MRIEVVVERAGPVASPPSPPACCRTAAPASSPWRRCRRDFAAVEDWAQPAPAVPPPDALEPRPAHPGAPPITHRLSLRPVFGGRPFAGAEEALTGGWLRVADPVAPDAPLLAFYADAWLPAPFPRLTAPSAAPTIDLTVHFRAPEAVAGARPRRAGPGALHLVDVGGRLLRGGRRDVVAGRDAAGPEPPARPALPGGRVGGVTAATTGYLGLGSNVGDRREQLQAAVDLLPAHGVRVLASSSTYDTDPVGEVPDQPAFLNACVRIATELDPEALLDACKAVERARGRETDPTHPGYVRHGPRPIDVDLLLLGDRRAPLRAPHAAPRAGHAAALRAHPAARARPRPRHPRRDRGWPTALAVLDLAEGVRRAGRPLRLPGPAG